MIVVMEKDASEDDILKVSKKLEESGFAIHLSRGVERTIIGAVGDKSRLADFSLETMKGVDRVIGILAPYKLASREFKAEDTIIEIGDVTIGGNEIQIMAGPCAVESREQALEIAHIVKSSGVKIMRGGAFKPRTSPYAFQGLGEEGLKILKEAGETYGLKIITEVMEPGNVELVAHYSDILQIGTRNMQNFPLLREVAKTDMPVLIKRGLSATIEEWIMAGEYVLNGGNKKVMLCERGIRTFETYTRNTLDLSAVVAAKQLTHLPVIVDPSHGTGKWRLVSPMALAAVTAGADGLIIEVHPRPSEALCDGSQSLTEENYNKLLSKIKKVANAVEREA
ncbi:3-deoxy-7-phosphoheptulonate synthase [Desulfitibacter alkalitolerans]|uniref:3-deoxy-7-phosphoheptulonate synthase n=1 Tax=Desulfitibacter alkalitolerans TaxID=264641 RepID=UPI000489ED6C|nr:3-deoxy-7-phosphoheptulonate synthase [Desulfitibacter alkalitolerans]